MFDLFLDFIVKRKYYDDTVFCIDEPELHINPNVQGLVLETLYRLLPDNSQLCIATHSAGMLRKAFEIYRDHPDDVVFLDFHDLDFDQPQEIKPARVDRSLWKRALAVALHDMADLIAPGTIVICEGRTLGTPDPLKAEFDARVYRTIFGTTFPDVEFVSGGCCNDIVYDSMKLSATINRALPDVKGVRVIDRDDRTPEMIKTLQDQGFRVLSVRSIENYLWSNEIMIKLCEKIGKPLESGMVIRIKMDALGKAATDSDDPNDQVKKQHGIIFSALRKVIPLSGLGNDTEEFCSVTLAKLVKSDTVTYDQLKRDLFG